ncbi:hypothetical protein AMTR_s00071p00076090 [Amborella trichopoda]|uniref:Uncharacterized protein n=1 Tax=Amborella trichopoda TaxID=13333 RepID=U5DEN3_AMBTC|nr:hypothetical protein AMTR_s00071p00076090 [Amborella trichopoda]
MALRCTIHCEEKVVALNKIGTKNNGHGHEDFREPSVSFETPKEGEYGIEGTDKKCVWLRSQLIGSSTEIDTPFGKRILTYADHTASGRALEHVENFVHHNVLPFYGKMISVS